MLKVYKTNTTDKKIKRINKKIHRNNVEINIATKESPSLPEKVLTGCKNSSWNIDPAGILLVLASAFNGAAKTVEAVMHKAIIEIIINFIFFI